MIAAAFQPEDDFGVDDETAKRILVIDDDAATREEVSALLRDEGYEVSTCHHGEDALVSLRHRSTDLIILDLRMPVMNGWQFRTVQRMDPGLSEIPVIAVSADDSAQAAAIHADHYLKKPLEVTELLRTIERIFVARERHKLAESLRSTERIALLATIAAGVGHEINNPLTYILGNVTLVQGELARLGRDGDLQLRYEALLRDLEGQLRDIQMGAERIRDVVGTLRWLSRPRLERHRPVDVARVLETSIAIASNQLRHRARLVKRIGPLPSAHGDEGRLGQVFVNLLVNAAQAIPPGDVEANRVEVTASAGANQICVEIHDTGVGISPEVQAKIFQPFFTTKDPATGTGLGLAISQNIVHEHGGRIEVESVQGRGSTFRVRLPVGRPGDPGARSKPSEPTETAPDGTLRVMVIDDDALVLSAIERMLRTGHEVVAVGRAREALALLDRDDRFDAILCDLMMPEMSGMAFYDELSRTHLALVPRVVFMTGGAFAPEAREFLRRVASPCMDKPFTREDLRTALTVTKRRPRDC